MRTPTRRPAAPASVTALALGLLLTACLPRATEPAPHDLAPGDAASGGKEGGALAKLGRDLIVLHEEYQAFVDDESASGQTFSASDPALLIADGSVAVDATASGDPVLLENDLTDLGLDRASRFGPVVSGYLPILALPDAAALPTLRQLSAAKAGLR